LVTDTISSFRKNKIIEDFDLVKRGSEKIDLLPAFRIIEEEARSGGSLVSILQRLQETYGYLHENVIDMLAKRIDIPVGKIIATASFYAQFRFAPTGKYVIKDELGIKEKETTSDGLFTLERVACLGCCSLAPAMMINERVYGSLTPDKIVKIIESYRKEGQNQGPSDLSFSQNSKK
jgi:NADH-quinone oxidoreductase subunit E